MTRTRALIAALLLAAAAGVGVGVGATSADAATSARCTSSYWAATRSAASFDTAVRAAAPAVWTNRYGNFGGWTITNVTYNLNGSQTVYGRRPGTNLYVSAHCARA